MSDSGYHPNQAGRLGPAHSSQQARGGVAHGALSAEAMHMLAHARSAGGGGSASAGSGRGMFSMSSGGNSFAGGVAGAGGASTSSFGDDDDEDFDVESALEEYYASAERQVDAMDVGVEQDYKNHNDLPLARIKRIMKSDEDVRMISAEAPVLFAKACELFITEITLRAWKYSVAEKSRRRTLQREDIQQAVQETDIFDFLREVIGMPGEYKGHAGQLALQAQQSAQAQSKSKSDPDPVGRSPSATRGSAGAHASPVASPYGMPSRSMHFQDPTAAASAAALASSRMHATAAGGGGSGNPAFPAAQHGGTPAGSATPRTATRTRKMRREDE